MKMYDNRIFSGLKRLDAFAPLITEPILSRGNKQEEVVTPITEVGKKKKKVQKL